MLWFPKLNEEETDWSDTVGPIAGISSTNAKYSNFADSVCEISACSVDLTDSVCRIFPIDGLDKIRNAVAENLPTVENLRHCYSRFLPSFCCVLELQYLIFAGYDAVSSSIPGFYTSNNFFNVFFPIKSICHYVVRHVRNA